MNSYASVDSLKGTAVLNVSGTTHDARYRQLLENVSIEVNRLTKREFFTTQETRYFDGPGATELSMGDLVSVGSGSLAESTLMDGTFASVWATADYVTWPYNVNPTSTNGNAQPVRRLQVNEHSNGSKSLFDTGQRRFEVKGQWGYSDVGVSIGVTGSASFNATATAFGVTGTVEIGWTIKTGTERMYVRNVAGTTVTVDRGVNGYTAGVVASGSAFTRVEYPGPITEAVIMQAGRLVKRAQGGYTQEIGLPEAGEVVPIIANGLDRDVRDMLSPYRKLMI